VADQPRGERSTWLLAGFVVLAMLLMPAIAWLLIPKPAAAPRPAPRRAEPTDTVPEPTTPRPARPAPRPIVATAAPPAPHDDAPVTGGVRAPDGRPAANAFVGCEDRDGVPATSSDEEGKFRLPPAAAGCSAIANHPTFIPSERVQVMPGRDNVLRLN